MNENNDINYKSIREALQFQELTEDEKQRRGILARLYGPCASIINPTRNGRKYSEELWRKVFNENEIVQEMFHNGGICMEMDHPADREDTCSEKIAAMMSEPPKEDKDGHLICYVDIIDTPCGKIAYQLAKYGFKLGISSRGSGDLYTDSDGNEAVDPDTYDFTTFDLVLLPAVKEARLSMCESYNLNNSTPNNNMKALRSALKEDLNNASSVDKRIMKSVLEDLQIDLDEIPDFLADDEIKFNESAETVSSEDNEQDITDSETKEESDDIKEPLDEADKDAPKNKAAEDTGALVNTDALIESLKDVIRQKDNLNSEMASLRSQLAVGDTKVRELQEELKRYKESFARISEIATDVNKFKKENQELSDKLTEQYAKVRELSKKQDNARKLTESLDENKKTIQKLTEAVTNTQKKLEAANNQLTEQMNASEQKISGYRNIAKKYKTKCIEAYNKYIASKASMLGVNTSEITNRLTEGFSIEDIDKICDDLFTVNVNISKLPVNLVNTSKMKITESASANKKQIVDPDDGYEIDDSLLEMAGLK